MTDSDDRPISQTKDKSIHLPDRYTRPMRVRIMRKDENFEPVNEFHVCPPFSIGYGDQCEIKLPKGNGPDRLFVFEPTADSKSVSLPLTPALQNGDFEVSVNGKQFTGSDLSIKPGSTVKIVDKDDDQEVELFVEADKSLKSHLTSLYVISSFLFLLTLFTGYLVFHNMQETEERLGEAETRLTRTETELSDWNSALQESVENFRSRQVEIEQSLEEISILQSQAFSALQDDFTTQLEKIRSDANKSMSRIADMDEVARTRLKQDTESKIAMLESEIASKLFDSLEQFKTAQNDLFILNTARIESLEHESSLYKDILTDAQKAVIFIRTSYLVQSLTEEQPREVEFFGTGFTVNSDGLSIAPQHVLKPWLYDDNMLAMLTIGQIRIIENSVKYTVWTADELVFEQDESGNKKYLTDTAFSTEKLDRGIALLYSADLDLGPQVLSSPFGAITVLRPQVGRTDIVVLQLIDFDREFAHLQISDNINAVEAMDEMIIVGYPLSRLQDGKSIPQGVRGFVRRQSNEFLELDTAMHPGSSGAPVLDRNTLVVGMAVALVSSDSYGLAVTSPYLNNAIEHAQKMVTAKREALKSVDCYQADFQGFIDTELWKAMHDEECKKKVVTKP